MRIRKVNSVDVKLYDLTKVEFKTAGNISRDEEIFNMFAAQYRGLLRVSINDYDSIAIKSTS